MKVMQMHPHKIVLEDGTEGLINSMVEVEVPDPEPAPDSFAAETATPPSNTFGTGAQ